MAHESDCPVLVAGGWLLPCNLLPFGETIGRWIGYSFDDADLAAIEYGTEQADQVANTWFTYPLAGDPPLELRTTSDPGADPITIEIWSQAALPTAMRVRVDAALEIFNVYRFEPPYTL